MQQFLSRCFSFLVLCGLGLPLSGLAQGITVSTVSPSAICAGKTISVPFSTTGTFTAGNTFTAQLSDASGTFGASTVGIGTLSASPNSGSAVTNLTITATVPANTATGSAYQVRVSSSGPARTSTNSVGLTVTNTPGAPGVANLTYCQGQTTTALSASPVNGATLNWYITETGGTASSVAPKPSSDKIGSTPYYVSQSLNGCESARATLTVSVVGTPAAPSTQASFSICQGAAVSPLTATPDNGATLLWYGTNANGGTGSSTAPTPDNQNSATYYVSQARGSCESARSAITVTVKSAPAAPGVSAPPAYCPGQTATALVATPSSGGTLNWYGTNSAGPSSSSATVPSTTTSGTTNYYVSQTVNGCESARVGIAVTVKSAPAAPVVSTPVGVCQNQSVGPLTATPSANGTLNWYGTSQSGGTPSTTAPTPSVTATGSTTYYVSQTVDGCEGPRASITVTVNAVPGAPSVQSSFTFCQGTSLSALSATPDNGATLRWYGTSQTGGSASTTAPVPDNQNSATYYVSQSRNGCEGPRAAISVTIRQSPAAPTVSAAPEYCPGQTATALTATPSAGATLRWYGTSATGGTASTSATVPSTTASATYYVSQALDGCESPRASISVTVKPTPAAPGVTNLSLCQNRSVGALTASGASGSTINWYGTSQTGTPSTTAPAPSVTAIGSTPYYVSQTLNDCESAKATLTVTVNPIPAQPTVTSTGPTYCQGVSAQPLSATGTALRWYGTDPTGGTGSSTVTTPSTGNSGTATYYVTQTTNGCESERAGIAITVKPTPARPDVVGTVSFCQNAPAAGLTATASAGATLLWYGTSVTGGTSTTAAPALSSTTPGTTTYYVSQTLDGCESANRSAIAVVVKPTPGAPGVTPVEFCNGAGSQQLSAVGSNIRWYDAAGTALTGAPTPPTNTVGQQTYQSTQTVDGCESQQKAALTVTIKPLPGLPGVTNLSYCQPTQDQPAQNVGPLTAAGENLRWYNTDNNAFQSAPTPPISQTGTFTYQVTQTVNGCEGGKATLQVAVNTTPAPTVATPLVSYCISTSATPLQATPAAGASLRWIDPYNRTFNEAPTPSTQNSNVTPGGDPFYVYQIGANGCYSSRATIRVIVNVAPTLALNGSGEVNLGSLAPVKLSFTGAPPFSYTLTEGYSGISKTNDTTIYVLPRGNTTYQIVSVANSCGVGLPGNPATATITVRIPTITTSVLQTLTACAGTSFAIPFTTTGQFNAGNLFTGELVSVADTSRKISVSPNGTTGTVVTAALPLTLAAGQYYVRVRGSNPSVGIIGSNSPSVLTVRARATATLTGTQSIYEGVPATLTVTFGGEAPWTLAYADSLRSYTVTATSSPYALEVRPTRTTTYQLTEVSNNCGIGTTTSGTAVVTVQKVLGVEDPALGPLVNVYPVPTTTTLTVDIDAALTRDPAVLTLHDAGGRPVLNQTTRARQTTLDVSQQPSGTYLLHIQVGDRTVVRRILKQ